MMYLFWIKAIASSFIIAVVRSSEDERSGDLLAETRQNYALAITPSKSLQTDGILECALICLRLSLCFYFNYQISVSQGLCEVFKGFHFYRRNELTKHLVLRMGVAFGEVISKGPYTCFDYLSFNQTKLENGLYDVREKSSHLPYTVYCDFTTESRFVWTLIQSMSFSNNAAFKQPYSINDPKSQYQANFKSYRMSHEQMEAMKTSSTHWRITCNFQAARLSYKDYVRGRFDSVNFFNFEGIGVCKQVDLMIIHGSRYENQAVPWWQRSDMIFHTDPSANDWIQCGNAPPKDLVFDEDNFGFYWTVNPNNTCIANSTSTTNTWVGRYI